MSRSDRAWSRTEVLAASAPAPGVIGIEAAWQGPQPQPGQFFMLRAERSAVLLGRAISVFDAAPGRLSFLVAARGEGSRGLCGLRGGDALELEGPLGGPWPAAATEASRSATLALVGGGIGLAPLAFLARRLPPHSYDFFVGFRSGSWGLDGLAPRSLRVFTEDGSVGRRGRVLDGFDPLPYSAILACGPEPMLKALAGLAAASSRPAWLSLERRMACGVGACLGCSVRTVAGNRRACVEGPVFAAGEVVWDE